MTTWYRHRTGVDTLTGQLVGVASLETASAVEGHVDSCSSAASAVLPGTIIDAANRIVRLDLSAWMATAEVGKWDLTWHPTFLDLSTPVWPENGADTIILQE